MTLRERLQRLRAPSPARSDPSEAEQAGLAQVETVLLGGAAVELPLKARLERLVAAAALTRARDRPRLTHQRLEELVQGMRVANARGECFVIEDSVHLDAYHGDVSLSRFRTIDPAVVGVVAGEAACAGFELGRAAFLDTETTGLAGGTGTAAFLVGLGYVDGERFRLRQYFMRDYHEEAALLHELAQDLAHFDHVVTFNGKMFDLPLLETRYRLLRQPFPLRDARHLDLLHPARRLWKLRLQSCRLQVLEAEVLGVRRGGDVPGQLIPQIYFDYVRTRDARALNRIFHHNRLDIVSLAAVAVFACQWVAEGRAEDARDLYSLARVYERGEERERSLAAYRRAAASGTGAVRAAALRTLAARLRREGQHDQAALMLEEAAGEGDVHAMRSLAIHYEHVRRDAATALATVEHALERLRRDASLGRLSTLPLLRDLRRRRERLRARVAARAGGRTGLAGPPGPATS